MDLHKRSSAVSVNTNTQNNKHAAIAITARGSDFYYAICGVMGIVGLAIIAASMMKPRTERIFFYITAAINLTACVAYFAMGSNLGWTPIDVEWLRTGGGVGGINREIFYVRYVWSHSVCCEGAKADINSGTSTGSSPRPFFSSTCSSLRACHGRQSYGPSSSTGS